MNDAATGAQSPLLRLATLLLGGDGLSALEITLRLGSWPLEAVYYGALTRSRGRKRAAIQSVLDALHEVEKAMGHGPARNLSARPWEQLWEAFGSAASEGLDPDTVVSAWEWRNVRRSR